MHLISDNSFEGAKHFPSMEMRSAWLDVLKTLNRPADATHVGKLWLCLSCRSFFIVNVPS